MNKQTANPYYGIPILWEDAESDFFSKRDTDVQYITHRNELAELSYTYLVECLTKSNKELRADMKFHREASHTKWLEYDDMSDDMSLLDFYTERARYIRVFNRHMLIALIAERLLSVVAAKETEKLDLLMAITDTPVFSIGIEYAENHPRSFPGFSYLLDNINLVSYLDNRYLFSRKG